MYLTNVAASVLTSRILGTVSSLIFRYSEERLGHRIIVANPGAADSMTEIMPLKRRRELA